MSLRVIQFQKIDFSFWNDVVYFMISVLLIVIFRDESFT